MKPIDVSVFLVGAAGLPNGSGESGRRPGLRHKFRENELEISVFKEGVFKAFGHNHRPTLGIGLAPRAAASFP